MKALVEDGKLDATHEVPCLVIGSGAIAQEASLAENFQRLAMNPADECLAFQQLIEQGADVEGIARRFGLTVRFVEGRLRLASLAPVVFAALGAGEITLDLAKAYAATPDRERQAFVFEQVSRSYMAQHPDSIRRMMTQATMSASDRRARFVGEAAYVAAGGRIERDLFSDEDGARWLDIALLERLATEKMEVLAAETAAASGLAFVRPTLESWAGYDLTHGLHRVQLDTPPLTAEESAEVEALEAETEELVGQLEDEQTDNEAREAAEARVREIGARIEALTDKPPLIPEELKPRIGTFLVLDQTGQPRLDTTYFIEPRDEPEEAGTPEGAAGTADEPEPAVTSPEPPRKSQGLSQALADELAIQRRDILAVHVAADPGLALDLAIFLMIDRGSGYSSEKSGSSLVALPPSDPVFGFKTPDAAATRAREEASEALDRSWTEADTRAGRFDAFRALPEEARAAWLAHAVARTLEASLNFPAGRFCAFHDHLGGLLGIEVAKWWRPTGASRARASGGDCRLSASAPGGGRWRRRESSGGVSEASRARRGRGPAPAAVDRNPLRSRPVLACRCSGTPARAGRGFGVSRRSKRRCGPPPRAGASGSRRRSPARERRALMHTTFAAQLDALELGHLNIAALDRTPCTDPVDADAAEQTLVAVWSDLFALFPDTAMEDDAEELGWAFVNLFHRAALKRSGQIDRATDEIRCLIASGDGSEVHASQLESEIARAQAAEAAMLALESLRETAARLYLDETGQSWRPAGGSRANHGAALTSAVVDGRGVLERLVIQAKEKGISVVDRRGPLGTHPKRSAREAAAA